MTAAKKLSPNPAQVSRILVYSNRKTDPTYFDASSEELEAGAYLALFAQLDEAWRCYDSLKDEEKPYGKREKGHPDGCMCNPCDAFRKDVASTPQREKLRLEHLALYKAAKKGVAEAARALLNARKDYEYEKFGFEFVESATSNYPPRVWGVTKPCHEAFIAENGIYMWTMHGRGETRALREMSHGLGYHGSGQEAALNYLTKEGPMKLDPKTRTEVDLGDEVWTFRDRADDWDEAEYMYRALCSEREYARTGIPILEAGPMKPGKVIRLTGQTCGGCRREMDRFTPK